MENLVYWFSCFLSCTIVIGLVFQFLEDRYKRTYENPVLYRIVRIAAILVVAMVNQKNSVALNLSANFLTYGMIAFFLYAERRNREYWRVLEIECFFALAALLESIGVFGIDFLMEALGCMPEDMIVRNSIEVAFSKVVLIFLYYVFLRRIWKKDRQQSRALLLLYLVMFLYSMVNFVVIVIGMSQKANYLVLCVNAGCVVFANLYLFYFMKMTNEKNRLSFQVAMMKQQESLQFEYYNIQKEKYRQSIAILHDVGKHIRSIEELYNAGMQEQAIQYTKEINGILKPLIPVEYSDNAMFNILLTDKKQNAEGQGIQFWIDIANASMDFMDPVDVTTLFGNLLENAIEACRDCKGERYIRISVKDFNEMLSVRIENSVEREVSFENGRPVREAGRDRGIGTLNAERCVEKYGGSILYKTGDGKFCCDIVLNK